MVKSSSSLVRLYFAAAPGDMDGERAVLEGLVLPELRERLRGEGIEIVSVDPAQATGEAWDLAFRFQQIAGCQIFLGLLGERYGEAPKAAPPSLVSAHPWLGEDPERSVLELEILQGALREPGARASFFYYRNPRFPFMLPEALQGRFLPESDEAITRLERLKERIRASGRPVFDGYPCGWSEGLGRASRLDTFAEQVFQDLWGAIQDLAHTPDEAFDPNATMLAFSNVANIGIIPPPRNPENQLDETMAAPPMPATADPEPASSRRWGRPGLGIAATIALAVVGLALFVLTRPSAPRANAIPVTATSSASPAPPSRTFPVFTPEAWGKLVAACRLGSDSTQAIPARAPAGSPMVQVFASTDGSDAGHVLPRYSSRHGFLLPLEENGQALCTVVLGPFPSQEAASRAAAELRMSDGTDAKVVAFPGFTK